MGKLKLRFKHKKHQQQEHVMLSECHSTYMEVIIQLAHVALSYITSL